MPLVSGSSKTIDFTFISNSEQEGLDNLHYIPKYVLKCTLQNLMITNWYILKYVLRYVLRYVLEYVTNTYGLKILHIQALNSVCVHCVCTQGSF